MACRLVKSASNGRLLAEARQFLRRYSESFALIPGRLAGEFLVSGPCGLSGVHRSTTAQLAAGLARRAMAERGLAPLTSLGLEAVTARVVHRARQDRALNYFEPVAGLPRFARAVSRTISELRLAGISSSETARQGRSGPDLALLLDLFQQELESRALADLALIFELACASASEFRLPLLLLDVKLETRAHRDFIECL